MRIKKIELIGFKSFKDRTVIQFDAGITGIVGPNGCGKSNIVDALVWVMGEQSAKHLRGSSMEDVIFAGAEGYAPMGMAEVSLTLENDGGPFPAKYSRFSEVMITRRLHRSGESEYLINKEPARLRDIQEIFMDTGAGSKGFSIIEQGAIGKIITAKPEDRRVLIEEAAGITKFKVRKRESQRKLISTDQNLVRLQDIIGEQKRQLDSLQRQAQRAERYRNLKNEIQEKELWLSSKNYLSLRTDIEAAESVYEEAKGQEVNVSSDLTVRQAELEQMKLDLVEREKNVEEKQVAAGEAQSRVQNLENEIRELNFEVEQARRNKEMTGNIVEQYSVRRDALQKDRDQVAQKLENVSADAQSLTQQYEDKRSRFQGIQSRIQQVDDELTEKRREMLTVSQSESHLEAREQALQEKLESQQERLENGRLVLNELKTQQEEFKTRRNKIYQQLESERQLQLDIMKDVENFESNLEILKGQMSDKQAEVADFKDKHNEVSSRLYGLENLQSNFEGFEEGVKNVMLWQRKRQEMTADGGVQEVVEFQPVAEVVEVSEEYELAMEAALGQRFQLLLSDSTEPVIDAVDYLKQQQSGRSSFVSKDWLSSSADQAPESLKSESGVVALLNEVVRSPEKYKDQVSYFLKDVVIVDSIRAALQLRPNYPGYTFVTKEGDTLSADGVLTGGSSKSVDSGLLKRKREIKELSQKREEWAGKLSLAQAYLKKLESQVESMTEELESARKQASEKEILVAGLQKDLDRAENELRNSETAVNKQSQEVSKDEALYQSTEQDLNTLREKMREIREKKLALETAVEELTQELKTSRGGIDELQSEVSRLGAESASKRQEAEGLRSQLEMLERSLNEVKSELEKMSEESQKSSESLSSNQVLIEQRKVDLERSIREAEQTQKDLAQARDEYEQLLHQSRDLESFVSKALHTIHEHQSRISEAQLKLEQLRMKEQYLVDQINERYMIQLADVAINYKDQDGDKNQIEEELKDLKQKISRIGEVNLSAIQEYDELIDRYNFLSQQYQDLTDSKEQLRKVIDRINRICSKRFKETFEQVNERFMKVFPVLFGGGEAKLILVEDPEKGEMGIDIVAKPPGKKSQNVGLLSGGEKALTAVSLIFAIFLVKPSPFCLLDEVDAPLDDANVFRFNDLVKEMAKRSQIIIVTHNKHTMRVNDKLYGVTQEEKGVSKMVSVDLSASAS